MLARRANARPTQPKCRNKERVAIVKMFNFGSGMAPDKDLRSARRARMSRKIVSVLVLAASVVALALIMENGRSQLFVAASQLENPGDSSQGGAQIDESMALLPADEGRYRALSEFVARRYRVSQDVAFDLVSLAHQEGKRLQLDPLLIIAVIAIESRFNPIAESVAGAKGLMQIIPKYHTAKLEEFGGEQAVFDPATNIQVGSRILREYIRHTGNVGIALQMYAGALGDGEDQYTTKVMNERRRLQQVLSSNPRDSSPDA